MIERKPTMTKQEREMYDAYRKSADYNKYDDPRSRIGYIAIAMLDGVPEYYQAMGRSEQKTTKN